MTRHRPYAGGRLPDDLKEDRLRFRLACPVAIAALAAAGCGGGGSETRLTLADFRTKAEAICNDFDAKLKAVGQPSSAAQAAVLLPKVRTLVAAQLVQLRELAPPAEIADKVDQAYTVIGRQLPLLTAFARAAASSDEKAARKISARLDELTATADALADDLGLAACKST
jgi:hypothetical protein